MIERYTLPKMKEIWSEENKFRKWLEVELAVCEAWRALGKIGGDALRKIKRKANFSIKRIGEIEKEVGHDLIAFLTSVAEYVGKESRFIHLGLTSYDVEDTALALRLRESAQIIALDIEDLIKILKKRAREHKNTVMIGRTHGVHAEPITFGLKLANWIAEMERNLERMKRIQKIVGVCKISGAVGTYANLDPRVEEIVCKKLNLEKDPASTQVVSRERHAEYLLTLALVGSSLERFATEVRNLSRTEILEVEEPFGRHQKGSSAMPHKKNPILCERITGLSRILRANALAGLENVALWNERDISHSSVERLILPDSSTLLDYMLQTFTKVMKDLVVYPENMKRNLEKTRGLIFSEKLLLSLVEAGLSRDEAYSLVQGAAMRGRGLNKDYKEVVMADRGITKYLKPEEIKKVFDIKQFLKNIDIIYKRLGI